MSRTLDLRGSDGHQELHDQPKSSSSERIRLAETWVLAMQEGDYCRALDIALDMLDRCTCSKREPVPF